MRVAIFDPFSGVSGDMTLAALIQLGLEPEWLRALPGILGLSDIGVLIREVVRGEVVCSKVDFEIPPQPHGRHIREIRALVAGSGAPERVRALADQAFTAIAAAEGEIHGMPAEEVHLHEVGAVDAILDVVGAIWGLHMLGVERVYCGAIALGDGTVRAAHGILPVPAPATLKLLEGHAVRPGPEGSGELVTPTGAALVRVLSSGLPPSEFVPLRSGFGAGTKDFAGRANALRIVLAEVSDRVDTEIGTEDLFELVCDIDDMSAEYLSAVADAVRQSGALDVVLLPLIMKRGRPGTRIEVLCRPSEARALEDLLLAESSSIGVRKRMVRRRALRREVSQITVLGHSVRLKSVVLPGGGMRSKPEFVDVRRVALATERPLQDILRLAVAEAERHSSA